MVHREASTFFQRAGDAKPDLLGSTDLHVCNLHNVEQVGEPGFASPMAECNSAIQQIANRRYPKGRAGA